MWNMHNKHLQNNLKRNNMRDLDKDCIYDLSDLNDVELNKVLTWLRKNDKGWNAYICRYLKGKSIKFERQSEQWSFYNGHENLTNAKTLFDPKVNIINPTKSESENTQRIDDLLKQEADKCLGHNFINSDLIQKPKYKFQHVEVNKINDSIDLVFFKEKKNGLIKVKRITYFYSANDDISDNYLDDVKISVIKFLEQCEK